MKITGNEFTASLTIRQWLMGLAMNGILANAVAMESIEELGSNVAEASEKITESMINKFNAEISPLDAIEDTYKKPKVFN